MNPHPQINTLLIIGLTACVVALFLRVEDLERRDMQCEWCMKVQMESEGK